jgi:hypothetical protein
VTEEWRPVPGFEGLYEVSNLGRVRSLDRVTVQTHFATGRPMAVHRRGVLLRPGWFEGYAYVGFYRQGAKPTKRPVHQVVAEVFIGARPADRVTRHLDGDSTRNHANNLAYGTVQDNSDDMVAHDGQAKGERVATAKLSAREIKEIRDARGTVRQVDISAQYGIGQSQVSAIQLGKSWRHV